MPLPGGETGKGNLSKSHKCCDKEDRNGCPARYLKDTKLSGHDWLKGRPDGGIRLRQELHLGNQPQFAAKLLT